MRAMSFAPSPTRDAPSAAAISFVNMARLSPAPPSESQLPSIGSPGFIINLQFGKIIDRYENVSGRWRYDAATGRPATQLMIFELQKWRVTTSQIGSRDKAQRSPYGPDEHGGGADMSAGFGQTYRAFAYNNAWANHRLLNACANLSQTEFEARRTGFFPSLQLTLNHIYVIDLFYVDALEGGWLGPWAWENRGPHPSVPELQRAQAKGDQRLIAHCNALMPDQLDSTVRVNRGTSVQTERRDRL